MSLKAAEDVGRSQAPAMKLGVKRAKLALEAPAANGEKGSGKEVAVGKEAAKGEEPSAVGEPPASILCTRGIFGNGGGVI